MINGASCEGGSQQGVKIESALTEKWTIAVMEPRSTASGLGVPRSASALPTGSHARLRHGHRLDTCTYRPWPSCRTLTGHGTTAPKVRRPVPDRLAVTATDGVVRSAFRLRRSDGFHCDRLDSGAQGHQIRRAVSFGRGPIGVAQTWRGTDCSGTLRSGRRVAR